MGFVQARPRLVRRFEEQRGERAVVQGDLEAARAQAERKAAAHKTFTPQELADRFPLFAGLTLEQREVLLLRFKPRMAEPGERIFRAGDEADGVYFISKGEVEVSIAGRPIKLGAGEVFGEMALISGQPALGRCHCAGLQRVCGAQRSRLPSASAQVPRHPLAGRQPGRAARETDRQLLAEGLPPRRRSHHERGEPDIGPYGELRRKHL